MKKITLLSIVRALGLVLVLTAGATAAHASYTYSQIGESFDQGNGSCGGTDINGNAGTQVSSQQISDPLGPPTPSGFLDNPTHFCYNNKQTYTCNDDGCDGAMSYHWVQFNADFNPGVGGSQWGTCEGGDGGKMNVCVGNSFYIIGGQLPDLTADTSSAQNIALGSSESFSAQVNNVGDADVTKSFKNIFEISSTSANFSSGYNLLLSGSAISSLAKGAHAQTSASWSPAYATTYYVRACADSNTNWVGGITESDETNNCGPVTSFTVAAANTLSLCGKTDGTGTLSGTAGVPLDIPVQGSTTNGDNVRYAINFDGSTSLVAPHPNQWLPSASGSYASGYSTVATYTWNSPGTYTVEGLTQDAVTGSNSSWNSCVVTIASAAAISCSADGANYGVGDTVTWTAFPSGFNGKVSYDWTATNGTPSSGHGNPFRDSYGTAGTYQVHVHAYDGSGNTADADCKNNVNGDSISVRPVCTPSNQTGALSVPVSWSASGGTTNGSYTWYDATSNTQVGTGQQLSQTYNANGRYGVYVRVNGINSSACYVNIGGCQLGSGTGLLTASPTRVATDTQSLLSWKNVQGVAPSSACQIVTTPNIGTIDAGQSGADCKLPDGGPKNSPNIPTQTLFQLVCGAQNVSGAKAVVDVDPNIIEN